MRRLPQILIKLVVCTIFLILIYYYLSLKNTKMKEGNFSLEDNELNVIHNSTRPLPIIYVWCIVVKVEDNNNILLRNFRIFLKSLLFHSKHPLSLNILTEDKSKARVDFLVSVVTTKMGYKFYEIIFHNIEDASDKVRPITETMQLYFSSVPGSYYSDSLFYISLGLHNIAPSYHHKVILVDIDIKFETDIIKLYEHFTEFHVDTLFGLAPELSPVYHHMLWKWKQIHPNSSFGEPSYKGFSGLNSGVMLMNLDNIRKSEEFNNCITREYIDNVTAKYAFKGHLGDQDFYTLLAVEKPHLIKILSCTWNRQLCQWWKHHGYMDEFNEFARCDGTVNIYHGNCNTPIPVK